MRCTSDSLTPFLALALSSVLCAHGDEPPHYVRDPFTLPGLTATVEQFSIASDQHLDMLAVRLGGTSGRILAARNDGRGLAANWTVPATISHPTNVPRRLVPDSCQVFEDKAFVVWLDDVAGAASSRLYMNRFDSLTSSWLAAPLALDASTFPPAADVTDFAFVAKRGTSGQTYLIVLASVRAGGADQLYLCASADAGATFRPPVPVSADAPGEVSALACDLRFGELHLGWIDDRDGAARVHYRRALLGFFGDPYFPAPELALSNGSGDGASGPLVLQTNAEFGWTGSDQKFVGIAYCEDDGNAGRDLHVLTSRDNGNSFVDVLMPQTAQPDTDVTAFDFEIPGDAFTLVWQDDSDGTPQIYRSDSSEGLAFTTPVKMSGFEDASQHGLAPRISPSHGTPDGACIVFVEENASSTQVRSNFSDQAFGGEWHDEEYPGVSQFFEQPRELLDVDVSYNQLYYNYVVAWRQETASGSGIYEIALGGFRPPQVNLEFLPNAMRFEVFHVPFQDTFGFVMLSLAPPTSGAGTVLYDGRRTGLVSDALTTTWLTSRWSFALFENESAEEGGETKPWLLPPSLPPVDITFLSLSWGPFGDLHTLSEPFRATVGPTVTPKFQVR